MTSEAHGLAFGVKTSQAGISYDEILRLWQEADQIDAFEHGWLWDHVGRCAETCAARRWRPGRCSQRWLPRRAGCVWA